MELPHKLRPTVNDALRQAWIACGGEDVMPFDLFASSFGDWEIVPVAVDGRVTGAVMMKGCEIHVASATPAKWISRGLIRRTLGRILQRHGRCVTYVRDANKRGQRFVERLGFVRTAEGAVHAYEMRACRHV